MSAGSLVGSAYVKLTADTAAFNSGLKTARNSFKSVSSGAAEMDASMKRSRTSMVGMAKAATGAFLAFKGVSMVKDAINAASDLAETQSKVNTVFGKSASTLTEWSNKSAETMGMSKQQSLDAAAGFAVYGKSAGMTGAHLAGFSKKLVGAASDMASFHNASPQETLDAIKSGLAGEAEPLKRFGILMNDATLKSEAMKLGLIKTTKEGLTPGQKVMAAQSLIMAKMGDAQGDFARTSGGLANQQRILKSEMANMSAAIGTALLPYALKAVTALRHFGAAIVAASKTQQFKTAMGEAKTVLTKVGDALKTVGDFLKAHKDLVVAFVAGFAAFKSIMFVIDMLKAIRLAAIGMNIALAANPVGLVVAALVAIGVGLVLLYKKSETFQNIVKGAMKIAGSAFGVMKSMAVPALRQMISPILVVGNTVKTMVNVVKALLHGDFKGAWQAAKTGAIAVLHSMAPLLVASIKAFGPKIVSAAKSLSASARGIGMDIVHGVVDGIKGAAGQIKDAMVHIAVEALKAAKDKLKIFSPSRVMAEKIGAPIAQGVAAGIIADTHKATGAMKSLAEKTIKAATKGFEAIKAQMGRQASHLSYANMLAGGDDSLRGMNNTLAVAKAQYTKLAAFVQANSKKMTKDQKAEAVAQLATLGQTVKDTAAALNDFTANAAKAAAQKTKDAFTDVLASISTPGALADAKLAYEVALGGGEMSAAQHDTALANARAQLAAYQAQLASAPDAETQTAVYQAMTSLASTINDLTKVTEDNTAAIEAAPVVQPPAPYVMNGAAAQWLAQIPHLASGGMARANRMHLVGEKGPELFMPGRTGRIVSNREAMGLGGGSTQVHVSVDNSGVGPKMTPQQLAQLGSMVGQSLSRGGTNARIYTGTRRVGG